MYHQLCHVKQSNMKAIIIFILTFLALNVNAMHKDSIDVQLNNYCVSNSLHIKKTEASKTQLINTSRYKFFKISTDWLLETKAEIINGISYSPTLEFNLSRPNGFNFQLQTGALPILNGLKIQKTQPAAGFSFSYKF